MKQEKIDELMNNIDKKCKLPKYWKKFIEKNSNTHHLIIKDKNLKKLYCTNCKKYFADKTVKVRDYKECPNCHTKSKVYGINYSMKSFKQSVILVQRMDKQIIIRVFEIYSYFCKDDYKNIIKSCTEYARILPGIGKFLGNNVDISMFGQIRVYHGYKKIYWQKYNGHKWFSDNPTYPFNKKRLLKGTNMEYAPINEFVNRFSYYGYNYLDTLDFATYESFEMLWKMKLYNLCFFSKELNKKGSFYKRFGVSKKFLKFMQNNNITYKELKILQLLQKDDIDLINKCSRTSVNNIRYLLKNDLLEVFLDPNNNLDFYDIKILKKISNFIPLKKLKNYSKGLNNLIIYRDYLSMSKKLGLNYKSKKDLFPRNLFARHDKLQKIIKVNEDMSTQFDFYLRYLELSKYSYEDSKYIIFPATSVSDLVDEGTQQGNCVSSYLSSYIEKRTEIYFIRKIDDVTKSFITLEFKNGKVVQKELPHHSTTFSNEQLEFIENWCNYRILVDKKEKYQLRKEEKIKEYNLKKLVG